MLEACRTLPSCKHARTDGARACRVRADLAEEHLDDRPDWQGRAPHTWAPLRPRSLPTGRPARHGPRHGPDPRHGPRHGPKARPQGTAQPRSCAISAVVSRFVRPAWLARHLAQSAVARTPRAPHATRRTPHSRTAARRTAAQPHAAVPCVRRLRQDRGGAPPSQARAGSLHQGAPPGDVGRCREM